MGPMAHRWAPWVRVMAAGVLLAPQCISASTHQHVTQQQREVWGRGRGSPRREIGEVRLLTEEACAKFTCLCCANNWQILYCRRAPGQVVAQQQLWQLSAARVAACSVLEVGWAWGRQEREQMEGQEAVAGGVGANQGGGCATHSWAPGAVPSLLSGEPSTPVGALTDKHDVSCAYCCRRRLGSWLSAKGEGALGGGDPFGGISESTIQQFAPLQKVSTAMQKCLTYAMPVYVPTWESCAYRTAQLAFHNLLSRW
jgi:hypothetical protein